MVTRDPFFLVGRADGAIVSPDEFQLADLLRLRLGSVSEVPTPWLCLQQDLRDAGIDPHAIDRVGDKTMPANLDALREGRLDVVQMFEPYVSMALDSGVGRILHAASARGPTAYTCLIATRDGLERNRPALRAAVRATQRMQAWLTTHGGADLAAVVAPLFPQIALALLQHALERYVIAGIWAREPSISRAGFVRLAQGMLSGGFVTKLPSYETCVAHP